MNNNNRNNIHCENINEIYISIKYIEYGSREWIFVKTCKKYF